MTDYGLQFIDPQRIRINPPLEPGWKSTKDGGAGTSRDTIDGCVNHIPAVREKIDAGSQPEDFDRLRHSDKAEDKATGDSYAMFWGAKPVDVTRDGDDFIVSDDGRHRVQAAQENGLSQIPARYHDPADDPEFAGKEHNAASKPRGGEQPQEETMFGREGTYRIDQEGKLHNNIEEDESGAGNREIIREGNPPDQSNDDQTSNDPTSANAEAKELNKNAVDQPQASSDTVDDDPGDGSLPSGNREDPGDGSEAAPKETDSENRDQTESGSFG
ncbi:MAG: hypothetical protein JST85_20195 [Acidobacteria bacterium]|nr:hypothetical protein [Acidobacteriota bacterium]